MTERTYTFHVEGMHCAACEVMLEDKLATVEGVAKVEASLSSNSIMITGALPENPSQLANTLTSIVSAQGYRIVTKAGESKAKYREFIVAIPAAATFIIAFLLLQKLGLVHLISTGEVTFGAAFVIGVIASVSTCLAVVGGLVLSISASAAKKNGHWQSQALFHVGRLGGFFVLGGFIGIFGKVFQLGFAGTAILSILVAGVMLVLGLNLLDTFPAMQRFQPRMPKLFARNATRAGASSHSIAPFVAGIATFFLPCGFTQSMQVYTLTTGSYLAGGFTMLAFALGTLPVLALLSFGALEISHKPWKGIFFKATGLVVIVFALFNFWNGLVSFGIVPAIYSL